MIVLLYEHNVVYVCQGENLSEERETVMFMLDGSLKMTNITLLIFTVTERSITGTNNILCHLSASFDASQTPPCQPPPCPPPPASQWQVGSYRNWNPPLLGNLPDDFLRILPQQLDSLPVGRFMGQPLMDHQPTLPLLTDHCLALCSDDQLAG